MIEFPARQWKWHTLFDFFTNNWVYWLP